MEAPHAAISFAAGMLHDVFGQGRKVLLVPVMLPPGTEIAHQSHERDAPKMATMMRSAELLESQVPI